MFLYCSLRFWQICCCSAHLIIINTDPPQPTTHSCIQCNYPSAFYYFIFNHVTQQLLASLLLKLDKRQKKKCISLVHMIRHYDCFMNKYLRNFCLPDCNNTNITIIFLRGHIQPMLTTLFSVIQTFLPSMPVIQASRHLHSHYSSSRQLQISHNPPAARKPANYPILTLAVG